MMAERTAAAKDNNAVVPTPPVMRPSWSEATNSTASTCSTLPPISYGAQAKRDSHKRRGDKEFRSSNYGKAVQEYTLALSLDPHNALLLSNRSAAYLKLNQAEKALQDAKTCILLDAESARGHARLAAAHHMLQQWPQAIAAYEETLSKSPNNDAARHDLEVCRQALSKQQQQQDGSSTVKEEVPKQSDTLEKIKSEAPNEASQSQTTDSTEKENTSPQNENLETKLQAEIDSFSNNDKPDKVPETKPHQESSMEASTNKDASPTSGSHSPSSSNAASPTVSPSSQNTNPVVNGSSESSSMKRTNASIVSSPKATTTPIPVSPWQESLDNTALPSVPAFTTEKSTNQQLPNGPVATPASTKEESGRAVTDAIAAMSQPESPSHVASHTETVEQAKQQSLPDSKPAAVVSFEDKKPAVVPVDTKPPAVPLKETQSDGHVAATPAKRSTSAHGGGLSELSKQLRLLQATNDSQSNEIDRLERQLRILAELKGVSVGDLQKALLSACEDEAHADLRNQLAILRSELEASTLSNRKKSKDSFDKEASDKAMANMELRVGELEEIGEALRGENRGLYLLLNEEKAKSTKLQHQCDSLKKQLDDALQEAMVVKDTEQSPWSLAPPTVVKEKETVQESPRDSSNDKELREAQLQTQLEKDRANLLEQQAKARENETQLLKDQYKSRFQVQDERIKDLEQQLSSLYAAFEMVEEEHAGDQEQRRALFSNLREADSQVVRQLTKMESGRDVTAEGSAVRPSAPVQPGAVASPQPTSTTTVTYGPNGKITETVSYNKAATTPRSGASTQRVVYRSKSSPSVPISLNAMDSQQIVSGFLLKRDKSILKGGWKKRYFVLHGSKGAYNLSYSESPRERIKGTIEPITTGVSSVAPSREFPKQPFVFVLRVNPRNPHAPVLHASAPNHDEYVRWLSALTLVTTGKDNTMVTATRTPQEQEAADHEVALRMQMQYMS